MRSVDFASVLWDKLVTKPNLISTKLGVFHECCETVRVSSRVERDAFFRPVQFIWDICVLSGTHHKGRLGKIIDPLHKWLLNLNDTLQITLIKGANFQHRTASAYVGLCLCVVKKSRKPRVHVSKQRIFHVNARLWLYKQWNQRINSEV